MTKTKRRLVDALLASASAWSNCAAGVVVSSTRGVPCWVECRGARYVVHVGDRTYETDSPESAVLRSAPRLAHSLTPEHAGERRAQFVSRLTAAQRLALDDAWA